MSTHRLGRGTVNVSANLLIEERQALTRIAVHQDLSLSHLVRNAITTLIARADAPTARCLAMIRRHRHQDILDRHNGQLYLEL
jgi:hypothetical protein